MGDSLSSFDAEAFHYDRGAIPRGSSTDPKHGAAFDSNFGGLPLVTALRGSDAPTLTGATRKAATSRTGFDKGGDGCGTALMLDWALTGGAAKINTANTIKTMGATNRKRKECRAKTLVRLMITPLVSAPAL